MTPPLVSVIIPTFNRASLLPRAIDSVIAQTSGPGPLPAGCAGGLGPPLTGCAGPRWEIIVVDDGSTDRTPELAWAYRRRLGHRFTYIRQANLGCCAARNRGIEESRGAFIAFLDSDDEFLPNRLQRQLALFEACPQLGLVYSDYAYVDLEGRRCDSAFDTKCPLAREVPSDEIAPGLKVCRGTLFDTLIRGYFVATIVGLIRREVLAETIRFPECVRYAAEWAFYLDISRRCPAGFVDEPLALHHFLSGSLTRTDKLRNNRRFAETLSYIERRFSGDMTRSQRRELRHRRALAHRQVAYDAAGLGQTHQAARQLWEAVACRPGVRDFAGFLRCKTASLLRPMNPSPPTASRRKRHRDARSPNAPTETQEPAVAAR